MPNEKEVTKIGKDLQEKLLKVQADILEILDKFTEETEFSIASVNVSIIDIEGFRHRKGTIVDNVSVTITT